MRPFLLLVASVSLACSTGPDTNPQPDAADTDASKTDAKADAAKVEAGPDAAASTLEQHCIDKINEYRATLSLPPYIRDPSKESCADGEAKTDALANTAHSAFGSCSEYAQNECPGYPSSDMSGSLDGCLAQMWAEGPGTDFSKHGHYINMTSTSYTHAFCGFYDVGDGTFWGAQDFY
jgi:hypothetical protein